MWFTFFFFCSYNLNNTYIYSFTYLFVAFNIMWDIKHIDLFLFMLMLFYVDFHPWSSSVQLIKALFWFTLKAADSGVTSVQRCLKTAMKLIILKVSEQNTPSAAEDLVRSQFWERIWLNLNIPLLEYFSSGDNVITVIQSAFFFLHITFQIYRK